ncbi:MAG: helix-turn-helix domain-containing protein [Actinomycetota bacterium]|nr:helix-turn-helix domain-containing protein [Actinomycetota bacterium]
MSEAVRPVRTSMELGEEIRRARTEAGLSQAALAARAGVGRPWLSELEGGKRTVEVGRVLSVLGALDLAINLVPRPVPAPGEIDLDALLDELG